MAEDKYVDPKAVAQGVITSERLIDRQMLMHQNIVDRAHQVTRLGIAELGGIAALAGFASSRGFLDRFGGILVIASLVIASLGVAISLRSAVGSIRRKRLGLGPDIVDIRRNAESGLSQVELQINILATYERLTQDNEDTIERTAMLLVVANYVIGISALIFLSALIYIFGRSIP